MPHNTERLLLGIDLGTSVIKSVLFSDTGVQLAKASGSVMLETPQPGWAVQDMEEIWSTTAQTIRDVLQSPSLSDGRIAGISVSGQGGGLWLIDREGKPVQEGITWLDSRSGEELADWESSGILAKINQMTGYYIFPGVGPLTLFHWFKRHDPKILARAFKQLWAKDWIKYRLTGVISTDETDPSNGHFLRGERGYSADLFDLVGIGEFFHLLPPIIPSSNVVGRVTASAARETGLPEGVPVASGAWDVSSTSLGAGCIDPGQALTILGTAGIHLAVSDSAPNDPEATYSICAHCVPNRWIVNSMAMTATANVDWFIRELWPKDPEKAGDGEGDLFRTINEQIATRPIGSNGVLYLPFLQGERAPFLKPNARSTFFGIGTATTRADLLRSIFEGVAFSTLHNYQSIERTIPIREVVLAGGGSKSEVWSQIIADCLNKPIQIHGGEEFGALGAALNAGIAVGLFHSYREAVRNLAISRTHTPDPKAFLSYSAIFEVYRELIEASWDIWDRLPTVIKPF